VSAQVSQSGWKSTDHGPFAMDDNSSIITPDGETVPTDRRSQSRLANALLTHVLNRTGSDGTTRTRDSRKPNQDNTSRHQANAPTPT